MNSTAVLLLCMALGPAQIPKTFSHDFRDGHPLSPFLGPYGPNFNTVMVQENAGLRITLPANREKVGAVGIAPQCVLHGDFEIRVSYELLSVDTPSKGYGAGTFLHVILNSSKEEATTLARVRRPNKDEAYWVYHSEKGEADKKIQQGKTFPTEAAHGLLCVRRTGPKIHYLVAEHDSSLPLHEIHAAQFGTEDVRVFRFAANTGGSPTALDVRFVVFSFDASEVQNQSYRVPSSDGKGSVFTWSVIAGMIIVVGLIARWMLLRKRSESNLEV